MTASLCCVVWDAEGQVVMSSVTRREEERNAFRVQREVELLVGPFFFSTSTLRRWHESGPKPHHASRFQIESSIIDPCARRCSPRNPHFFQLLLYVLLESVGPSHSLHYNSHITPTCITSESHHPSPQHHFESLIRHSRTSSRNEHLRSKNASSHFLTPSRNHQLDSIANFNPNCHLPPTALHNINSNVDPFDPLQSHSHHRSSRCPRTLLSGCCAQRCCLRQRLHSLHHRDEAGRGWNRRADRTGYDQPFCCC